MTQNNVIGICNLCGGNICKHSLSCKKCGAKIIEDELPIFKMKSLDNHELDESELSEVLSKFNKYRECE